MFRRIKAFFAWRDYRHNGVWLYQENMITGQRRALKVSSCYQPLDLEWLTRGTLPALLLGPCGVEQITERWTMPTPPKGGSAVMVQVR